MAYATGPSLDGNASILDPHTHTSPWVCYISQGKLLEAWMLGGFQNEALSSPAHALPPETSGTGLFLFPRQVKTEPSLTPPPHHHSELFTGGRSSFLEMPASHSWGGGGHRGKMEKCEKTRMVLEMLVMWHSECTADCSKPFLGTC